ncbi:MAG: YfbM family protein [Phycisphaerales bacterium]|nr:YfbM family protein [Phycisphaerales bacterium]
MSMILAMREVTEEQLKALFQDPESIEDLLFGDDEDDDGDGGDFDEDDESPEVELGKDWHALHFLLSGDATLDPAPDPAKPLAFILAGGKPIGDVDVGYGPARGLSSAEVRAVAAALRSVTPDQLRARFNGKAFDAANIYPGSWDSGDSDALDDLMFSFEVLKTTVTDAASNGHALLIYMW